MGRKKTTWILQPMKTSKTIYKKVREKPFPFWLGPVSLFLLTDFFLQFFVYTHVCVCVCVSFSI